MNLYKINKDYSLFLFWFNVLIIISISEFLDKIFLRVIKKNSEIMPDIFFKMFSGSSNAVIKFLSNKSNIFEDFSIILKMPKWTFIKALFRN